MIREIDGSRRTVDELVTLHELEPDLHEIYTEGRTDARIVEWFLLRHEATATVYPISDRVEIDFDVSAFGVDFGEKGKVVAVAQKIAVSGAADTFTCIVDADYWYTLESPPPAAQAVLLTDYADLNMYCFDDRVIQQFLSVCLRAPAHLQARNVLSAITPLLQALFVIRWLLRQEVPGLELVPRIERRINRSGSAMALDVRRLLNDTISASPDHRARAIDKTRILESHSQLIKELNKSDVRRCINGHDFVRFLCHYLDKNYPELFREDRKGVRNVETANITLLGCLDAHDLAAEGLFAEVLTRLGRAATYGALEVKPRSSGEVLSPSDVEN